MVLICTGERRSGAHYREVSPIQKMKVMWSMQPESMYGSNQIHKNRFDYLNVTFIDGYEI